MRSSPPINDILHMYIYIHLFPYINDTVVRLLRQQLLEIKVESWNCNVM